MLEKGRDLLEDVLPNQIIKKLNLALLLMVCRDKARPYMMS